MALRAMSADSHMDLIYVPPDTFSSRMPERWGERTPHVVERDGRRVWVSGEDVLGPYGVYGPGVTGRPARADPGRGGLRLRARDAAIRPRPAPGGPGA